MEMNFEKYAAKGNKFLKDLSEELVEFKTNKAMAMRVLRAVFSALRERITIEESFGLIAQLPMSLKSVYVDQWKFSAKPNNKIKHLSEFMNEVIHFCSIQGGNDLRTELDARIAVKAVFTVLKKYVSKGELDDIIGVLPKEIGIFIQETEINITVIEV